MIVIKDKMFWLLEALSWAGGFVKAFLKPILNSSDSEKLTRIVKKLAGTGLKCYWPIVFYHVVQLCHL